MLRFSQESVDAAKKQLHAWNAFDAPVERRVDILTQRLDEWNKNRAYGVRDAILSGTRIRLLDQVGSFDDARFNCAEAGVNMLLLASQLGLETEPLVLRYQPGANFTDHLAVLCKEGDRLRIIDPLMSHSGDVRMFRDALVIQTAGGRKILKGAYTTLDQDAVLRHRNFINGPSGFFPYYADSQRITEGKHRFSGGYEWRVRTQGEELHLLFTGAASDDILMYTFERVYASGNVSDRHILHLDNTFTAPHDVVFMQDQTSQVIPLENRYTKHAMAHRYGIRIINDMMIKMREQAKETIDELLVQNTVIKEEFERLLRERVVTADQMKERFRESDMYLSMMAREKGQLRGYKERINAKQSTQVMTQEEAEQKKHDQLKAKQRIVHHKSMPFGHRWMVRMLRDASTLFKSREGFIEYEFPTFRQKLWRPFQQTPEAQETLTKHLECIVYAHKTAYRHDIKRMFSSPAVNALLSQYRDALETQRFAERMTA